MASTSVVVEACENVLFVHFIWGKVSPQKWRKIKGVLYERFGFNAVSESSHRSFTSDAKQLEIGDDGNIIMEQKFMPVM